MAVLEQNPPTLTVPLREEPPGVLRVGRSRVLLELVIRAYQNGAAPQEIVRTYNSLELGDVFAVIAFYLAHTAQIDDYLRKCDQESQAARHMIEGSQPAGPTKQELLARVSAKG